jgi:hypothetical protein
MTRAENITLVLSDGRVLNVQRPTRPTDVNPMTTALTTEGEAITLTTPPNSTSKRRAKGTYARQGRRSYNQHKAERRSYRRVVAPQRADEEAAGMPLVDGAVTLSFERQRDLIPASQFDWAVRANPNTTLPN